MTDKNQQKNQNEKKIIVMMPTYMAQSTLEDVFERFPKKTFDRVHKFLIMNDCSPDNTHKVGEKIVEKYGDKVILVNNLVNLGYAKNQKKGYSMGLNLGGDIFVMLHGDGQYPPESMEELYTPLINDEADVVMGSRMMNKSLAIKGGMPLYKVIGNTILTTMENFAYGMKMSEYHSGYMLYSKKTLETIKFHKLSDSWHFDGEMLMMAGKKKLRIKEISIPAHYGNEICRVNSFNYGLTIMKIIIKNWLGKYNF